MEESTQIPERTGDESADATAACVAVRAEELRAARRLDSGIALVRRFLEENPPTAGLHFVLGNLLYDKGELNQAQLAYEQVLEIDPHHSRALNNLAVVYKAQGKISRFTRTYRKAMRAPDRECLDDRRGQQPFGKVARLFLRFGIPLLVLLPLLVWLSIQD